MSRAGSSRRSSAGLVLRTGVVDEPEAVVLEFLEAYPGFDARSATRPTAFAEADLRWANRSGARIAATEIAAILDRRVAIERALRAIAANASLAGPVDAVPWFPLGRLFDAFAEIRGVGFSKMTKALHPKRPALVPMLDSVVHEYLKDDDPGSATPFGERGLALVRGYKRDLDDNRATLGEVRRQLAHRGHELTEVRILDVVIWSTNAV